jgi:hypothetical protein
VVVTDGLTEVSPPAVGVTMPTPLSIENFEPFVVVHESLEVSPVVMDVGDAERVQLGLIEVGGGLVTVTLAVHGALVPPMPVAMPV